MALPLTRLEHKISGPSGFIRGHASVYDSANHRDWQAVLALMRDDDLDLRAA